MFIIIDDNNTYIKTCINSSYRYKGISIYSKNNTYYISLDNDLFFIDNTKCKVLKLEKYIIRSNEFYYDIKLYVYESDFGIDDFRLYKKDSFIIARDDNANIVCNDPYLKDTYLFYKDAYLKTNWDVLVNNHLYTNQEIKQLDVVEYLGIKIIFFDEFLYINNFNIDVKLDKYEINESNIKYPIKKRIKRYMIDNQIKSYELTKIDAYKPIKKTSGIDRLKSLLPSIMMAITSMAIAGINLYYNYLNNNLSINSLTTVLMPVSIFISSVFIPIIFILIEKHDYRKQNRISIQDYLKYLDSFEKKTIESINAYCESLDKYLFSRHNLENSNLYIKPSSKYFLELNLGYSYISEKIEYSYSFISQIDTRIDEVLNRINKIDIPVFIDLKKYKSIGFICNGNLKQYLLRILLEVISKYSNDDVAVGLYSKNTDLINEVYNLGNLYLNKNRLIFADENRLVNIDSLNLDKPLLMFISEDISYKFRNPNIICLYFVNECINDVEVVIEINNTTGIIHDEFDYKFNINEEYIDYDYYFSKYSKYNLINYDNKSLNFFDIFKYNVEYNYIHMDNRLVASFAYNNDGPIYFDLHESKHGPHGLIGGSTGSGKSELIISLLLSICIRYSPEYLNIVLIDYKGEGIKDSLSYNGQCLQHIVASISNLSNGIIERFIIYLSNECVSRQERFKKLSSLTNISIMNLDDYNANYYKVEGMKLMPHLLIMVDEFAELKKSNPDQIKQLVSICRIGRSLGIHLILSTQKPSGVIDDEIFFNSRFKIGLKVYDEKDSLDLIKSKECAYISEPGSFIMLVDNSYIKAKSIYTKTDINGNDIYKVELLDSSLNEVNSTSIVNKNITTLASYFTSQIIETCNKLKLSSNKMDFFVPISKYRKDTKINGCLLLGEKDDYINNIRDNLIFGLKDNLIIFSNRVNEINSIINTYNENQSDMIIISNNDFEGEYISDCIKYDDNEDLDYLLDYILVNNDLKFTLIVEDIDSLLAYDDSYLDRFSKLVRKSNSNINYIFLSKTTSLSLKLLNCFKNKVLINIKDDNDISNFYGYKSRYIGESFYFENEPKSFVPIKIEEYSNSNSKLDNLVLHIPSKIKPYKSNNKYFIGYDLSSRKKVYCDKNTIICSYDCNLIDRYRNVYKDLKTIEYSFNTNTSSNNVLWIGSGVYSQRLFISNIKRDLNEDEGLYVKGNKKVIIKILNYE